MALKLRTTGVQFPDPASGYLWKGRIAGTMFGLNLENLAFAICDYDMQ